MFGDMMAPRHSKPPTASVVSKQIKRRGDQNRMASGVRSQGSGVRGLHHQRQPRLQMRSPFSLPQAAHTHPNTFLPPTATFVRPKSPMDPEGKKSQQKTPAAWTGVPLVGSG